MKLNTIRRLLSPLLAVTFVLISLGGAVRAMHAGLACPDWPLCFGDVIPDYQIQVYYEFIHRVVAGLVAIGSVFLAVSIWRNKQASRESKIVAGLAIGVLAIQIIMGGLTVLKLLHSGIVTSHLGFGMAFFGLLVWLRFSVSAVKVDGKGRLPKAFFGLSLMTLVLVFGQIILGGLVSTNYAGVACPDFPLCLGEFIPTFEGLQGLQVIHRLGAYTVAITVFSLYLVASKHRDSTWMDRRYYNICGWLVILVLLQIGVGAANVLYRTPPVITVLHLALATLIFSLVLRLLYISHLHKQVDKKK